MLVSKTETTRSLSKVTSLMMALMALLNSSTRPRTCDHDNKRERGRGGGGGREREGGREVKKGGGKKKKKSWCKETNIKKILKHR